MNIRDIAHLMDPLEFEQYAAELVSGAPALGRIEIAWHVLDRKHRPALVMCKHVVSDPSDVLNLHALLLKYNSVISQLTKSFIIQTC